MSPGPSAIRVQDRTQSVQVQPFSSPDLFRSLAMEIVVDWQMPSDGDRKG